MKSEICMLLVVSVVLSSGCIGVSGSGGSIDAAQAEKIVKETESYQQYSGPETEIRVEKYTESEIREVKNVKDTQQVSSDRQVLLSELVEPRSSFIVTVYRNPSDARMYQVGLNGDILMDESLESITSQFREKSEKCSKKVSGFAGGDVGISDFALTGKGLELTVQNSGNQAIELNGVEISTLSGEKVSREDIEGRLGIGEDKKVLLDGVEGSEKCGTYKLRIEYEGEIGTLSATGEISGYFG